MNFFSSGSLRNGLLRLAALTLLWGCSSPTPVEALNFSGEEAYRHARRQVSYGPRVPGTEAHRLTGDYILETLERNGWKVSERTFQFDGIKGRNIIGMAGPERGDWILLGAHYDTRPIADKDIATPNVPVMGANDGASGVAVLLELSRVLVPSTLREQVWLSFFDLEDSGGIDQLPWALGSMTLANSLDRLPDAVVIVDMVGDADLQIYYERNSDRDLSTEIWNVAEEGGFSAFIPEVKHGLIDDHTPFLSLGVAAIDIIDFDYPYWHTAEDTLDKISADSLYQVGRTLQDWIQDRQTLANSLE